MRILRISAFILALAVMYGALGCGMEKKPTDKEILDTISSSLSGVEGFTLDKREYGEQKEYGRYPVGVWGHGKVGGADYNFFVYMTFNRTDDGWKGYIPSERMVGELQTEKDRESFYKDTLSNWRELNR